jgi:anti-sigma-K factor RskA
MSEREMREDRADHGQDAAAYVLGALPEQEAKAFVEHMRECASCREEVATLQPVVDALPAAVPQRTAPAELRGRVLATVQVEAELRTAGGAGDRAGARRADSGARGGWRAPWRLALGGLAAAAAAVVLALALSGGGGARTRVISAHVSVPRAEVSMRLRGDRGELLLARMPQSPPGRVYEVWVQRAGVVHPTDALFTVTSAGGASVGVPGSLAGASAVLVTAEPRGGSSRPTSAPVIAVRLS